MKLKKISNKEVFFLKKQCHIQRKIRTEKTQDFKKITEPKPNLNPKSNPVREIEPKFELINNYEKKKERIFR